jgi:formate dehydrogenase major subunit
MREINGYRTDGSGVVDSFTELEDDGSTACGCWIYSGVFAKNENQARRRDPGDLSTPEGRVSPEWAWAWPANRRILYNRASADPDGKPWSERKKHVWWDEQQGKWTGYDVPDFPVDKRPDYRAPDDATGMDAISGDDPFIMMADGRGWLYTPSGLLDGPLPTHYEPIESPVGNLLYPEMGANPSAIRWKRPENPFNPSDDSRYPLIATTFRLTEQHTAGGMSRKVPWLAELQPEMFAEIDPQLAADRGIDDGGWMTIVTERAEIEARAKVTERMRPLRVDGRLIHQVALPWHWGYSEPNAGDSTNDLGVISGDPNVSIQESKAFTCDVRAGRRSRPTSTRLAGVSAQRTITASDDDAQAESPKEADE